MARLARVIAPGMPHHVTQRGNRRQQTFFGEEDYQHYLELISRFCRAEQVAIWAYCLMPNHVHLIVVPQSAESLHRAIGKAHRRYSRWMNFREGWRGHLWQGHSPRSVMDEDHLLIAARYMGPGPPCAGLVQAPSRYRWSSQAANLRGRDDALVRVRSYCDHQSVVSSAISTSREVICSPLPLGSDPPLLVAPGQVGKAVLVLRRPESRSGFQPDELAPSGWNVPAWSAYR